MVKNMNAMNRLLAYNPNLKQSWMLFIICILCQIVGVAASIIIRYSGITTPEWDSLSAQILSFIALALIVVRLGKESNDEPDMASGFSPFLWMLLVPFILSVNMAVKPLTGWISMPDFFKQMFADISQNNLPVFLSIVIVAPLGEEWISRGIILKGLLKHYSPRKAIVWSAVIFGIIHFNPWQAVSAFFIGLAIGWIYWRTRSLWLCVFMHAVNNAAAFVLTAIFPDSSADVTLATLAGGYYIYFVVLAVCALSWITINKIISPITAADIRVKYNGT
jgi:membrane protease YdiL (CAAX protease family)